MNKKIQLTLNEAIKVIKQLQTVCKDLQKERDYYKNIVKNAKKSDFDVPDFFKGFRK